MGHPMLHAELKGLDEGTQGHPTREHRARQGPLSPPSCSWITKHSPTSSGKPHGNEGLHTLKKPAGGTAATVSRVTLSFPTRGTSTVRHQNRSPGVVSARQWWLGHPQRETTIALLPDHIEWRSIQASYCFSRRERAAGNASYYSLAVSGAAAQEISTHQGQGARHGASHTASRAQGARHGHTRPPHQRA